MISPGRPLFDPACEIGQSRNLQESEGGETQVRSSHLLDESNISTVHSGKLGFEAFLILWGSLHLNGLDGWMDGSIWREASSEFGGKLRLKKFQDHRHVTPPPTCATKPRHVKLSLAFVSSNKNAWSELPLSTFLATRQVPPSSRMNAQVQSVHDQSPKTSPNHSPPTSARFFPHGL